MSAGIQAYPLSPHQAALLAHAQHAGDRALFVVQMLCRFTGPIDPGALEQALELVSEAVPALRTSFVRDGEHGYLQREAGGGPAEFGIVDLRGAADPESALQEFIGTDRQRGFVLEGSTLTRMSLIRQPDGDRLLWTVHHAVLDGWSLHLCMADLLGAYEAILSGGAPAVASRPSYRGFVEWSSRQNEAGAPDFLQHFARLSRTSSVRGAGNAEFEPTRRYAKRRVEFTEEQTGSLRAAARSARLTLATLVYAAWGLVLAEDSDGEDVAFGVTMAIRPEEVAGSWDMAGLLMNILPLRVGTAATGSTRQWLATVYEAQLDLQEHSHLPMETIARATRLRPGLPLFESTVAVENYPIELDSLRGGISGLAGIDYFHTSNLPIEVLAIAGTALSIDLAVDTARYCVEDIEHITARFVELLRALPDSLDQPFAALLAGAPARKQPPAAGQLVDDDGQWLDLQAIGRRVRAHPDVLAAEVTARQQGRRQLLTVTYSCSSGSDLATGLREWLAPALPPAPVTIDFVTTGQPEVVEKDAAPAGAQPVDASAADELAELTQAIAGIIAEHLQLETVDPSVSFFDLGGSSLGALRLLSRIEDQTGRTVSLLDLFVDPSARGLAEAAISESSDL